MPLNALNPPLSYINWPKPGGVTLNSLAAILSFKAMILANKMSFYLSLVSEPCTFAKLKPLGTPSCVGGLSFLSYNDLRTSVYFL